MSDYNNMMAKIGSVSIEFSTLAASIGELQLSHDRLLDACKAALPELSGRLPWHVILTDAIDKAPRP